MEKLERILYVDDDSNLRDLFEVALEMDSTFDVMICASGPEALRKAPVFAPQLIVLDVKMPGMDGPTTLVQLRAQGNISPAVFATAESDPVELERLKSLGVEEVIIKPFDPFGLADKLSRIWERVYV